MRYSRLRRTGSAGGAERQRAVRGTGYTDPTTGYRVISNRHHPTSDSGGHCLEHRVVLFDSIGPGEHPCHWCGRAVAWFGRPPLVVDHLDEDKVNNDPSNLAPSCIACNALRGRS